MSPEFAGSTKIDYVPVISIEVDYHGIIMRKIFIYIFVGEIDF